MALSQNDWCPTKERKQTHGEKGAEKTQTATCQQRQSRAPLGRAPRGLEGASPSASRGTRAPQ